MPREMPKAEQIFYDDVKTLITNLLIENKNYRNGHYYSQDGMHDDGKSRLLNDTKERAGYILERMEQEKHLINL